jgi:hypothetical protein
MNISKHVRLKYVERIKEITNQQEKNQYIAQNTEMIDEHILKMFNQAKFTFRGQLGGSKTTTDYYIFQDSKRSIGFVVQKEKELIITMYVINFNFPDEISKTVISGLLNEMDKINSIILSEKDKITERELQIESDIDLINEEIKILESKLKFKKEDKEILEKEKQNLNNNCIVLNQELTKYALQIFGNTEYKEDVKSYGL